MPRWSRSCQIQFSSVAQSCPTLRPHELQHTRPPCPWPTPGVHSDSRPSSQWCHPAISSSVVPFSSCPQSLPASESFPMSQLFTWGGQSTGVSALVSFLPKKSQGWSPSEWTGWISLGECANIWFLVEARHMHTWAKVISGFTCYSRVISVREISREPREMLLQGRSFSG